MADAARFAEQARNERDEEQRSRVAELSAPQVSDKEVSAPRAGISIGEPGRKYQQKITAQKEIEKMGVECGQVRYHSRVAVCACVPRCPFVCFRVGEMYAVAHANCSAAGTPNPKGSAATSPSR